MLEWCWLWPLAAALIVLKHPGRMKSHYRWWHLLFSDAKCIHSWWDPTRPTTGRKSSKRTGTSWGGLAWLHHSCPSLIPSDQTSEGAGDPRPGCTSPKLSHYEAFPLSCVSLSICGHWGAEEHRHPKSVKAGRLTPPQGIHSSPLTFLELIANLKLHLGDRHRLDGDLSCAVCDE